MGLLLLSTGHQSERYGIVNVSSRVTNVSHSVVV